MSKGDDLLAYSGKRTVCVDFDGCLAEYDGWKGATVLGEPLPGAKEFMEMLHGMGIEVVIYTCRAKDEHKDGRVITSQEEAVVWEV